MSAVLLQKFGRYELDLRGEEMHRFATELFPICCSITGGGIRETLTQIGQRIRPQISEAPTSTPVFDWTVPKEWNIRDAYIKDGQGRRVVDFRKNNLHVVSYSTPVHAMLPIEELRPHLHSLKDYPDRIALLIGRSDMRRQAMYLQITF